MSLRAVKIAAAIGSTWHVPADYRTPASSYPIERHGSAALVRRAVQKGSIYEMYGIDGYKFFVPSARIPTTLLQIRGKTWMVDDPVHWQGIQEYAKRVRPGRVLVAGLGLGLIVHALATRDDIERIDVVERNEDVINLISPYLPLVHSSLSIVHDDFWSVASHVREGEYSTLFVDLWVGDGPTLWHREVNAAFNALDARFPFPKTETLIFGFQPMIDRIREIRVAVAGALSTLKKKLSRERRKSR